MYNFELSTPLYFLFLFNMGASIPTLGILSATIFLLESSTSLSSLSCLLRSLEKFGIGYMVRQCGGYAIIFNNSTRFTCTCRIIQTLPINREKKYTNIKKKGAYL